ncbi:UDP-N-acetylmuramoyl-L-alanine--D-glutamate ligase [Candidatus Daviesbacteria bacterium]|nr:UDP-N-acetylmuramoyl-L-alanine--D-glutamate ligase [Candidatus Daviesbacteria bacterium]
MDEFKNQQAVSFRDKKVLILGLGLNQGGVGAAKFFAKHGAQVLVTDLKSEKELEPSLKQLKGFENIEYHLGGHNYDDIDWADLIIRNPALRPDNPYRLAAQASLKRVELDMGVFLDHVDKKQVIAVTGTKGKSTTSSLIFEALKANGKKVIHAGNIGKSVLDFIDEIDRDTFVVLEVSSFQLEAFDKHSFAPKWAVITNIFPDHLNYYKSLEEYVASKKLIAKYQTKEDKLFLLKDDPVTNHPSFLDRITSQIILFSKTNLPKDFHPLLIGEHNLNNIAAAFSIAQDLGLDLDKSLHAFKNFKGVEFRIQLIKTWQGVKIYNDTTATMPEAAIESLKSLPNCILICGGMNKGLDYKNFAKAIEKYAKLVYFIEGDATDEIIKHVKNKSKILGIGNNLKQVVHFVTKHATTGDVILFSPGATSFNFWQNEFDRGRKFNLAVEEVFK